MTQSRNDKILQLLNEIVFPCLHGASLLSGRPALLGVQAFLCAKEISELLENRALILSKEKRQGFKAHKEGIEIVKSWAKSMNLAVETEVDISIGVADVLVFADDIGIFEIGTIQPMKMVLLLKYIVRLSAPYTVHFWPYGRNDAFVFKNWRYSSK